MGNPRGGSTAAPPRLRAHSPQASGRRLRGVLAALDRAGRRRWLFPLLSACTGALLLLALTGVGGLPQPNVHDEFSYVLGADTFASGRLANPPHPLWEFFESIHVLAQPTHASKYQPGQALFLALGQAAFGHPYYGVVLENALLFAALCWMLQVWLAPAWALAGTALSIVSIAGGHYWGFSYWGGSAAALAGALMLGAWHRVVFDLRMGYGWLAGAAAVLLMWTRPFEGGLLAAALAVGTVWWFRRQAGGARFLRYGAVPMAAMLAAGLACQCVYNRAVTGNPWQLPYLLDFQRYHVVPVLWTGTPTPDKVYPTEALRLQNAVWEPRQYQGILAMPATQRADYLWRRLLDALNAVVPVTPWLPFAFLFWRDSRVRLLLLAAMAGAAVLCLETWIFGHYLAPWIPLVLLLGMASLRRLRGVAWRGRSVGAGAVTALLLIAFGTAALRAATEVRYYFHPVRLNVGRERARIAGSLAARGGRHVVVVRYAPTHDVTQEWVYNGADIDGAPVVWARDRGPQENQRLVRYFASRNIWLFEPDARPATLAPYR